MCAASLSRWRVFADTGGTFTDCLGIDPQGSESWVKVLSTGDFRLEVLESYGGGNRIRLRWPFPKVSGFLVGSKVVGADGRQCGRIHFQSPCGEHVELEETVEWPVGSQVRILSGIEAPLVGCHLLTRTPLMAALPCLELRLATTRATNALLEGKGAKTVLAVTRGFRDLLRIGDQTRPDLFALNPRRPEPLHTCVVEIGGRLDASGREIEALDLEAVQTELAAIEERFGYSQQGREGWSIALSLLHSDLNPGHEEKVAAAFASAGWGRVSTASALCPFSRYLHRTETTVANAYLEPVLEDYLDGIQSGLRDGSLSLMGSSGGLISRSMFRAKDSLLSGPAGGLMGAVAVGRNAGWNQILAFDMGGTSTDVSRYDGGFDFRFEQQVGPARVLAPALRIETVASGGGSICGYRHGALSVGPESAGADPGPACYGLGGPFTLTDVQLLLGRIHPERFCIPLTARASRDAFTRFIEKNSLDSRGEEGFLEGFLRIANERMAGAIRCVSVREGKDPADFGLVVFGGAGGLHACSVANLLGIQQILAPAESGVLSARGLERAPVERFAEKQMLKLLRAGETFPHEWDILSQEAREGLKDAGTTLEDLRLEGVAEVRLAGQLIPMQVPWERDRDLDSSFARIFSAHFGFEPVDRAIELSSLRLRAAVYPELGAEERFSRFADSRDLDPGTHLETWCAGRWLQAPVYWRCPSLHGGGAVGPAHFFDAHSSFFLEPGWTATVGERGSLLVQPACRGSALLSGSSRISSAAPATCDEIEVELFTQRFRNGVSLMGEQLRRTSLSTNVRERLDFSCCLLDREGWLVANAPHIPVHLGAMGLCVREVAQALNLKPGDVAVTNHPGFGGSHLPDITVVTPVFDERNGALLGYVANRAHHAEIGGIRPGSMAPDARSLEEEGVVIAPMKLFRGGTPRFAEMRHLLLGARFPSRNPAENLADLEAQVAANRVGERLLREWCAQFGADEVERRMSALRQSAALAAGEVVCRLPPGEHCVEEFLDDGTAIRLRVCVHGGKLIFDFSGTDARHRGSLNATPAIVRSAAIYVLRVLSQTDLPLNEGLMDVVRLELPNCFLNPGFSGPPERCPAVAGGNVETSQRLVEALLRPFGVIAGSQGTMNNVVLGGEGFSYYETVGGGTGAGHGFDGCSGMHSHMTNTAITDPEILERRYPVRLRRFELREGSGGEGRWRGGDGLVREIEFLRPATLCLLTQHRTQGPQGMGGGGAGKTGGQWILRGELPSEKLEALAVWEAQAGEVLRLETPGGGGWGAV